MFFQCRRNVQRGRARQSADRGLDRSCARPDPCHTDETDFDGVKGFAVGKWLGTLEVTARFHRQPSLPGYQGRALAW
jgi:hypothetical protein